WETVDVFGNHGLCGLPEEGAHGKSPKCLGGNLGDFGEFCKGLRLYLQQEQV
ncbi:pilin, partial [Neisseria meningitidis]